MQACGKAVTSGEGKVLQPQGCKRLILVLHNLDVVRPDKYATTQVHAFVHQVVEHGGFYDSQLAFTALHNIQIVATAGDVAASTTPSPAALPPRLARALRTLAMHPVSMAEAVLAPRAVAAAAAAAAPPTAAPRIAGAAIKLLHSFVAEFPATSTAPHLAVSLSHASALLSALQLYDWGSSGTVSSLAEAFCNEAAILFRCRLHAASDRRHFDVLLANASAALGAAGSAGPNGQSQTEEVVFSTLGASAEARQIASSQASQLSKWPISKFKELVCPLSPVIRFPDLVVTV